MPLIELRVPCAHLSFDTLNGINYHGDGSLRQRLEALLRVDVHTRQPAAKTRVTVVPSYNHLWSEEHKQVGSNSVLIFDFLKFKKKKEGK